MARTRIAEFGIIQKGLAGASVAIYVADTNGESTGVLVDLYAASSGSETRSNPQTLDTDGMLENDCWVEEAVMAEITNISEATERSLKKIRANPLQYALPITTASVYGTNVNADAATASAAATTATTQAGIATAAAATSTSNAASSTAGASTATTKAAEAAASALLAQNAAALLPLNNYAATTDPTVNDDSGDGYSAGSEWLNTSSGDQFICTNASLGAAQWTLVTISSVAAVSVEYDNTSSGMTATTGQAAIDELDGRAPETGDTIKSYRTSKTGWVMASGRTIGNASSGATERANADTQALFELLWTNIAALEIQTNAGSVTTRGASASADYAANKRLALPDERGRADVGKDDMGGTAANRLTTASGGVDGVTLGADGGSQEHTLTVAQVPSLKVEIPRRNFVTAGSDQSNALSNSSTGASPQTAMSRPTTGGGGAHPNVQPSIVKNVFIKL